MNWLDWLVVLLLGTELVGQLVFVGRGEYNRTMKSSTHIIGALFYAGLLCYVLTQMIGS